MDNEQLIMDNSKFPNGWKYGALEDALKKGSSNISLNKVKDDEGEYPLFSAKGFNKNISFFQQEQDYLAIIKDGAGIGRVSKHPAKSSVVATMQYLVPKDGFDIGFVEYFLNGIDFEKHRNGSTIPHIYFKDYKSERFPILPLPEQKRIVSTLDRAFEAIDKAKANAEHNLKNAKELFQSKLQAIFDNGKLKVENGEWEAKTLGEVLLKTETINPKQKPDEKFIYLDVSSVNKETKLIENTTLLLGKDAPSRARKLVKTDDIIFATVRPTHSRVAVITEDYDNQVCSTGYYVLRAKKYLNNNFIYYFLLTYGFNKQMEKLQKGASYPAVTNKEVESINIPFPKTINKQKQIVKKLNNLSAETKKLEVIYQQKIVDLEEFKKSVLQKAFNGEL
ncbi:MAG: restriction endonuclease subunit S [Bacteroidota bacterium]|nr:restriction endonuclease subunit S [Bacteroidota bacterium]